MEEELNNPNGSCKKVIEDKVKSTHENEKLLNCSEKYELKTDGCKRQQHQANDLELMLKDIPLTEDTTCGWGFFKSEFLQKFANKKAYVFLYGLSGCIFSATYAYFNATITTLEKRYKIPSKTVGFIGVGNDISSVLLSGVLSYYAGKSHRPRWVAFGIVTIALFCLLTSLPHYLYGSGQEALSLTVEHGAIFDDSTTHEVIERENKKKLCQTDNSTITECEVAEASLAPQVILFVAQLIAGIGGSLYYTLGASYMDDNIQKSKTPALISFSYFLRTLGPALGYTAASFCLKIYIAPGLTPTISNTDPRWLGAWWMGWIIIGAGLLVAAFFLSLFPRELPRAAARRIIKEETKRLDEDGGEQVEQASFGDMLVTFKRILKNKTCMLNHFAAVFYFFGYMPYWIFTPKYIETQYKQSASVASLVTGSIALAFSAIGILASGVVISKFKPSARYLAGWNVFVGGISIIGIIWYIFLGCLANENSLVVNQPLPGEVTCNSNCHCDFVKYSPVCGDDGKTYISPCHAGCTEQMQFEGTKLYQECSCITTMEKNVSTFGTAVPNACPINCQYEFYIFLFVMCLMKFFGATGRASNFLVGVRCVDEKDKAAAMGLGMMIMCLLAFVPSPIFFGALLDSTCILWGKTCSGTGNCWLYDNERLRLQMNLVAAAFVSIGTFLDGGVWYLVKDLKIFDDEEEEGVEMEEKKVTK